MPPQTTIWVAGVGNISLGCAFAFTVPLNGAPVPSLPPPKLSSLSLRAARVGNNGQTVRFTLYAPVPPFLCQMLTLSPFSRVSPITGLMTVHSAVRARPPHRFIRHPFMGLVTRTLPPTLGHYGTWRTAPGVVPPSRETHVHRT